MDKNDKQLLALAGVCFTVAAGLAIVQKKIEDRQNKKRQADLAEHEQNFKDAMATLDKVEETLDKAIMNAKFWLLVTQDEEE